MGYYSDCYPEAVDGDQIHISVYEIMMFDHKDDKDEDDNGTMAEQEEEEEDDIDVSSVESEEEDEVTADERSVDDHRW